MLGTLGAVDMLGRAHIHIVFTLCLPLPPFASLCSVYSPSSSSSSSSSSPSPSPSPSPPSAQNTNLIPLRETCPP